MKYYFEIEVNHIDYKDYDFMWEGYDMLMAQGNTLEELLDGATVFLVDQDGGVTRELSIWDTSDDYLFANLIADKFHETIKAEYEKTMKRSASK